MQVYLSFFIILFFSGAFPNLFGRYNSDFFASSFAAAGTAAAMSTATPVRTVNAFLHTDPVASFS